MKTDFPIDLVYLWVDGNDPKWMDKKFRAMGKQLVLREAVANERFEQFDELKYSLRSASTFAPWINHIFIVTDNQVPAWLKKHPKITIVDHTEIIPAKYLPTFNSSCIELFLHKTPGLAEHFLFANDDMFMGRPLTPDFFFDQRGNPIVMMEDFSHPRTVYKLGAAAIPNAENIVQARANVLKFAYDRTGIKFNLRFRHAIEPMRKSYLAENIEGVDYDEFIRTTATPFRENQMIQRMVFPLLDYGRGRNQIVYTYSFKNGRRIGYKKNVPPFVVRTIREFGYWLGILKKDILDSARFGLLDSIKNKKPKLFCLNTLARCDAKIRRHALEFLNETFPQKSKFEAKNV